jgi:hypothetical protein
MLRVLTPANDALCPPGYYMLWLLDTGGRPSDRGAIVNVGQQLDWYIAQVSLESYNFPGLFIRHSDFLGELTAVQSSNIVDREDATFLIEAGFADTAGVSLQSVNRRGFYLRHQDFRLKLQPFVDDPLFRADATFFALPGLADAAATSFRSYNYPDHFVRHRDFHLWVEAGIDDLFKADATFRSLAAQWPTTVGSLESFNYPGFFLRHSYFLGELTKVTSVLDRQDASFRLGPGLALPGRVGAAGVSFESVNYPGLYLRHQDFRLKLQPVIDDLLFRADATFIPQPGLADPLAMSFRAFNYQDRYLRHREFHLWLEDGNDDLFRADATFRVELPPYPTA